MRSQDTDCRCCSYCCRGRCCYRRRNCCREAAGGSGVSTEELLEASWSLQSFPWRALGDVLKAPGAVLEALGEPLTRLERSGDCPGGVSGHLGVVLVAY